MTNLQAAIGCAQLENIDTYIQRKIEMAVLYNEGLKETHAMRYFFKPEIDRIAAHAGFQCLHAEEWLLSGKAIGCDTWSACFVLKASLHTTKPDES